MKLDGPIITPLIDFNGLRVTFITPSAAVIVTLQLNYLAFALPLFDEWSHSVRFHLQMQGNIGQRRSTMSLQVTSKVRQHASSPG